MITRWAAFVSVLGLLLMSNPAGAQAPGASPACKAGCEQRCQGTRLSKGECLLRCTNACMARTKGKK